jgi:hypothetical protein
MQYQAGVMATGFEEFGSFGEYASFSSFRELFPVRTSLSEVESDLSSIPQWIEHQTESELEKQEEERSCGEPYYAESYEIYIRVLPDE